MRYFSLLLMLVAIFSGCSGQSVRTFNDEGLKEQELATVYTSEKEGLFGTFMAFVSVDGVSVRGHFDKSVDAVKVTPGKHTYVVKFHDNSFSLLSSDQHLLVTFEFDAISGHEYIIHFVVDKTLAQRFTYGGKFSGWIEDKTTGEKLALKKPEPTLQDTLDMSAQDLALGYLSMKHTVRLVAIGDRTPITIGKITINKNNVEEYKAKFEGRLSLYKQAIKQRGFKTLAGKYKGEATKSCAGSSSLFAALIQQQNLTAIEITQDDMDAQIILTVEQKGKQSSLSNPAAVVESAMVVNEATNSDYFFRGDIKKNLITFKPDVSVLKTWPKWANPPSRKNLEKCIITLERL